MIIVVFTVIVIIYIINFTFGKYSSKKWVKIPAKIENTWHDKGQYQKSFPIIRYSYFYNNLKYSSSSVFNGFSVKPVHINGKELSDVFKEGSVCYCWVNPANPNQAYLIDNYYQSLAIGLIIIIFCMLISYFIIFMPELNKHKSG